MRRDDDAAAKMAKQQPTERRPRPLGAGSMAGITATATAVTVFHQGARRRCLAHARGLDGTKQCSWRASANESLIWVTHVRAAKR